jgi:beta propeller repeat protein
VVVAVSARRWFVLTVLAVTLPSVPAQASGGFTFSESPVAVLPNEQDDPAISWPYVTYTDYSSGNADVYYADLRDGSVHPAAVGPGDQQLADISGDSIVYTSSNGGDADVYVYDIATAATTQITATPTTQESNPTISDDLVAWESYGTGDGDVCVYRRAQATTTCLPAPSDQITPAASGDRVAYVDSQGNAAVDVYDAGAGTTRQVYGGGVASVALDGNDVAWAEQTPLGYDVAVYDLARGTTTTLALPGDQLDVSVSGDWVSFDDEASGQTHLGLWNYVTGEVEHPPLSGSFQASSHLDGDHAVYISGGNDVDIYALTFASAADTTPPVLHLPANITTTATAAAGAAVSYSATATDDTDPSPSVSCTPASGSTFAIGPTAVQCTATDVAGNTAHGSFAVNVRYAGAGTTCLGSPGHAVLQPVNADGSSVFKQGSTVPVKFRVCDANGNSIGSAGVVTDFRLVQTIAGTVTDVNEAVTSTTPDTSFRWDSSAQQWVFNVSTKSSSRGTTYVYRITLNDGSTIDFRFGLR